MWRDLVMKYYISDVDGIIAKFRREIDRDIAIEALRQAFPFNSFYAESDD